MAIGASTCRSKAEPESEEEVVVNGNVRLDLQITLAKVTDTRRWKDERSLEPSGRGVSRTG